MSLMRTFIVELISIPVRSSGSTPSCMNISREQYGAHFNSGGDCKNSQTAAMTILLNMTEMSLGRRRWKTCQRVSCRVNKLN